MGHQRNVKRARAWAARMGAALNRWAVPRPSRPSWTPRLGSRVHALLASLGYLR